MIPCPHYDVPRLSICATTLERRNVNRRPSHQPPDQYCAPRSRRPGRLPPRPAHVAGRGEGGPVGGAPLSALAIQTRERTRFISLKV